MEGRAEGRREGCHHRQANRRGPLVCRGRPQSLHRRGRGEAEEGILRGRRARRPRPGLHRLRRPRPHGLRRTLRPGPGREPPDALPLRRQRPQGERLGAQAGTGGRAEPGLLPGPGPMQEAPGEGHLPQPHGRAAGGRGKYMVRPPLRRQPGHDRDALREVRGDRRGPRVGGLPQHQDGRPLRQAPHGQPGRGVGPLPRRQRLEGVEEQDDAQGTPGRDEPQGHGVRRRRRAHLRSMGSVDGPERQDQGRPPEARRLDGYEVPGDHRRRGVCRRQQSDLERESRQDDLHPPGRRPPHPPRRQRQGLHGADHDGPEPEEAEHRVRVRRRDRGLLSVHRHRGGGPLPPISALGQTHRAPVLDRVLQVLEVVRELRRHPHRLQDLREAAEGRRRHA